VSGGVLVLYVDAKPVERNPSTLLRAGYMGLFEQPGERFDNRLPPSIGWRGFEVSLPKSAPACFLYENSLRPSPLEKSIPIN
jgi:hypothetical protein